MTLRFKKLYFTKEHVPLIRSGKITTTWRLFNHGADLEEGDVVKLFDAGSGDCFGKAKIVSIRDKKLSQIDEQDRAGYENYQDPQKMYARFTNYYGRSVGPDTAVRIIKFTFL